MLSRLRLILKKDCYLEFNQTTIVGVSGGADSFFLLDVLWRLEIPLIVAHYNHQLQPNADEAAVKRAILRLTHTFTLISNTRADLWLWQIIGYYLDSMNLFLQFTIRFQLCHHTSPALTHGAVVDTKDRTDFFFAYSYGSDNSAPWPFVSNLLILFFDQSDSHLAHFQL